MQGLSKQMRPSCSPCCRKAFYAAPDKLKEVLGFLAGGVTNVQHGLLQHSLSLQARFRWLLDPLRARALIPYSWPHRVPTFRSCRIECSAQDQAFQALERLHMMQVML